MPRRTSTPAPGARSPGCRRSHDPWRKVDGIRPRTPRRRLPQRSRNVGRLQRADAQYIRPLMSTSPPAPPADRWGDRLPRRLGFWSAVAVLVGSTIGGGIFRTPAVIAERVPAPLPMFSVWVLGGLLALCGALTYAELAALFPRSGGVYVYIREGCGRLPAFLFGWTELVLIRAWKSRPARTPGSTPAPSTRR